MNTRYILTDSPTHGEQVLTYSPNDMIEIFGERGSAQLAEGETIFMNGSLYTDMVAAARDRMAETLEG